MRTFDVCKTTSMIHMLRPVTVAIAIGTMIAGCGGGTDDAQDPGLNDAAVARPDAANSGTDDPGPGPVADAGASNPDVGTPSVSYCDPAEDWPEAWEELELEVLRLANIRRSDGASCGNQGNHAPTVPLELDGSLRCAARIHSQDMAERNYFSHTNPDGDEPWDRMELAASGSRRAPCDPMARPRRGWCG